MRVRAATFRADLQSALLNVLDNPYGKPVSCIGTSHWFSELHDLMNASPGLKQDEAFEAVWSLIRQGLAYIDTSGDKAPRWRFHLTDAGKAAANDQESNPDNSSEYIRRLKAVIPEAGPDVIMYADEAMTSYMNTCYLACAVMLGAGSEAAFLEMARSFGAWTGGNEGKKFLDLIDKQGTNFVRKFDEFRRRVEPKKPDLPDDLADGMGVTLFGIMDLLRIHRNEAGHPTGKRFERGTMFAHLQMFPVVLRKMYDLKAFFDGVR